MSFRRHGAAWREAHAGPSKPRQHRVMGDTETCRLAGRCGLK